MRQYSLVILIRGSIPIALLLARTYRTNYIRLIEHCSTPEHSQEHKQAVVYKGAIKT